MSDIGREKVIRDTLHLLENYYGEKSEYVPKLQYLESLAKTKKEITEIFCKGEEHLQKFITDPIKKIREDLDRQVHLDPTEEGYISNETFVNIQKIIENDAKLLVTEFRQHGNGKYKKVVQQQLRLTRAKKPPKYHFLTTILNSSDKRYSYVIEDNKDILSSEELFMSLLREPITLLSHVSRINPKEPKKSLAITELLESLKRVLPISKELNFKTEDGKIIVPYIAGKELRDGVDVPLIKTIQQKINEFKVSYESIKNNEINSKIPIEDSTLEALKLLLNDLTENDNKQQQYREINDDSCNHHIDSCMKIIQTINKKINYILEEKIFSIIHSEIEKIYPGTTLKNRSNY